MAGVLPIHVGKLPGISRLLEPDRASLSVAPPGADARRSMTKGTSRNITSSPDTWGYSQNFEESKRSKMTTGASEPRSKPCHKRDETQVEEESHFSTSHPTSIGSAMVLVSFFLYHTPFPGRDVKRGNLVLSDRVPLCWRCPASAAVRCRRLARVGEATYGRSPCRRRGRRHAETSRGG